MSTASNKSPFPRVVAACFAVLIPFLISLGFWEFLRYRDYQRAESQLLNLAQRLDSQPDQDPVALAADVLGVDAESTRQDRERLVRIAQTVRYRSGSLERSSPPQSSFEDDVHHSMFGTFPLSGDGSFGFGFWLQAFMMLIFPGLFMTEFLHAGRRVRRGLPESPSFQEFIGYERRSRFLDTEGLSYFFRRLGFAFFIGMATSGLLGPAGNRVAAISEYVRIHSIPGTIPPTTRIEEIRQAPPQVIGFAGFYLYALSVFVQRFMRRDLSQRMIVSLFLRGLIVMILSFSISAVAPESPTLTNSLVFLSAVFPQTAINYLTTFAKTPSMAVFENDDVFPEINEIDLFRQTALKEHNIANARELATADLADLLPSVGMDPAILLKAADRALLVYLLGVDAADKLRGFPVYTATDLALYVDGAACYETRWREAGREPATLEASLQLEPGLRESRYRELCETLEVRSMRVMLALLYANTNFQYVLDNKLTYQLL